MKVWEFDQSEGIGSVAAAAIDGLAPPSWTAREVASRGDVLTLQLDAGARLSLSRSTRYYLEKRGPYRMLRHEVWPASPDPRVLVTLQEWPQR